MVTQLEQLIRERLRAKLRHLTDQVDAKLCALLDLAPGLGADDAEECLVRSRAAIRDNELTVDALAEYVAIAGRFYHLLDAWCVVCRATAEEG